MKRLILLILLSYTLFLLQGCGYSTASLLPPGLDSIHVENFANQINPSGEISEKKSSYYYRHGLETDITNKVIDKFIIDKNLTIKSRQKAALILKGALVDIQHSAITYDGGDNIERYRLEIFVNLELYNNLTGKVMWKEDRFSGSISYDVTGPFAKSESTALVDAADDLAQRIIERIIEAW